MPLPQSLKSGIAETVIRQTWGTGIGDASGRVICRVCYREFTVTNAPVEVGVYAAGNAGVYNVYSVLCTSCTPISLGRDETPEVLDAPTARVDEALLSGTAEVRPTNSKPRFYDPELIDFSPASAVIPDSRTRENTGQSDNDIAWTFKE